MPIEGGGRAPISPLAKLRAPQYPFPSPATVKCSPGFDGFVVLSPPKPNADRPRSFERIAIMRGPANAADIAATSNKFGFIVDFREGFDPTPDNLIAYFSEYRLYLSTVSGLTLPAPGDTPVIT
jgi:hypothetical protein